MSKPTFFSGAQPSGNLHIGNYMGAIKNWANIQEEYKAICCVVNLHAITVPQDPKELNRKTIEVAKLYIAAGLDPAKVTIFRQSDVPQHAELMWLLNTITKTGELFKMTQFKDKSGIQDSKKLHSKIKQDYTNIFKQLDQTFSLKFMDKQNEIADNIVKLFTNKTNQTSLSNLHELLFEIMNAPMKKIKDFHTTIQQDIDLQNDLHGLYKHEKSKQKTGAGLLNYPILMAADILLYDADVVPVGEDQTQHIEITRTLARRFNTKFNEIFKVPNIYTSQAGKKIMALDDPLKKMSKSAPAQNSRIELLDEPDVIRKKIMKATTDGENKIYYSDEPEKAGLKNLLNIFSIISDKTPEEIAEQYQDKGYGDFKKDLAEALVNYLKPIQDKFNSISDEEVLKIFKQSEQTLLPQAKEKITKVKQAMGLE